MSFDFDNATKLKFESTQSKIDEPIDSNIGNFDFNSAIKLKQKQPTNEFTAKYLLNNPTNNIIFNNEDKEYLKSALYYKNKYGLDTTKANVMAQVAADGYSSFHEANQKNALLISNEAKYQNGWENFWDAQWAKTKKRWHTNPEALDAIIVSNSDMTSYSDAYKEFIEDNPEQKFVKTRGAQKAREKLIRPEAAEKMTAKVIESIEAKDWYRELRTLATMEAVAEQIYTQEFRGEGSQSLRKSWQEGNYVQAFKDIGALTLLTVPDFATMIGLSFIPFVGVPLAAGYIGATSGLDRYQQGIQEGEDPRTAQRNAAAYAASEIIFERMGALGMLNDIIRGQKKELVKTLGNKIIKHTREPSSEALTQISQNFIDGKPLSEGLEESIAVGFAMGETVNLIGYAKNKLTSGDFNRLNRQTKQQIQKNIDESDLIKDDPEGQRLYQAAIDDNSDANVKAWNDYVDNKLDKLIDDSVKAGEGKTLTEQEIKDIRETSIFDDVIQKIADKNNVSLEAAKEIYIASAQAQDIDIDVQVDNAKKAIANIAPDVEVVIHDTNESYVEATGSTATGGIYDPAAKIVHINKSRPNQRTVAHEVFHAVFLNKVKNDAQAQQLADELFKRIYRNSTGALRAELDAHRRQYGENLQSEEALAELASIIATNYDVIDADGRTAIRKLIDFIGKGLQNLGFNVVTDKDVIDLMNTVGGKIARGETIEQADVAVLDIVEKGKLENIENAKVREQKIKREDIEKIPKHKNATIINNFKVKLLQNKMTSVTHSDRMVAGRYKDTDFFGGILYSMVTGRVWAFDSEGTAKGFVDALVKDEDGYYYFIPAIMSDTSHLSNRNMTTIIFNLFEDAVKTKTLDPADVRNKIDVILDTVRKEKDEIKIDLRPYKDTILQAFDAATTPEGKIVALKDSVLNEIKTFDARKLFITKLLGKATSQTKDNFFNSVGTLNTIGQLFAEPLADRANIREAPVVIRFKGEPEIVKTKKGEDDFHHDSYSYSVQVKTGKVETLILSDVIDVVQAIPEFKNQKGQVVNKEQRLKDYEDRNKSINQALSYIFREMGLSSFAARMTGELGQPDVRTMNGTRIKRHINPNGEAVGKRMGQNVFVHKQYETDVVPKDILDNAKKVLGDFEYNTIRYNRETGAVRFDESANFDKVDEPTAGNYIEVSTDGTTREGSTDSVFHHKWLWVKNGYTGFNVRPAISRSQEWTERIARPSGSPAVWKKQLEEAGLSKRERKDLSTQYSDKLGKDVLKRSGDTQVGNTISTVKKVKQYIVDKFIDGRTLDYGAGLGKGAEAINADSLEVNPEEGVNPTYTDSRDIPSNSYDNIISTSVLNVVPPDIRDYIVEQVARILRPNGVAVFTVRAKITAKQKTPQFDIEPDAYLVKGKKGLQYQKAFAKGELETYIQNLLGKGFIVETVKGTNISGRVVSVQKIDNTDAQLKQELAPTEIETRERKAPEGEISQEDIDAATQEIKDIDEATREERRAIRVKEVVGFDRETANDIRDALDMLELDEPTRRSLLDVLDNVKEEKFDDQADALAEEILNRPRPISDKEVAGLALKITKLYGQLKTAINKRNEAMNDGNEQLVNELQSEIGRLYNNMDKLQTAMATGATETARGLRAMAIKITEDKYDLINVRNQARTAKGEPLNETESKILEEGVKDIEKKRIRFETKEQKIKRLLKQLEKVRKMHREKYRQIRRGKPLDTKEEADIKEQIKLIRAKMRLEDATATVEEDLRLLKQGRLDEMSINKKKNQPKEIKELEKEREALYKAKAKLHREIYKMRGKYFDLHTNIVNFMRALKLWGDSWLGRQGIKRLLSNPVQTLGVFFQSFPSTFSDMRYLNLMEKMKKDKDYERMEEAGVSFMDIDQTFEQQQEGFGSNWADKFPWIRASNRNMVGGLNMLRYTMMKDFMVKNPDVSQEVLMVYAKHVNESTGRGNAKFLDKNGKEISKWLLAPRFVLSQIQTLFDVKNVFVKDSVTGKKSINKALAKEIGGQWARTWLSMVGIVQGMALLGWEFELDPEESDFLKFRKDDVVIDFMFGGKGAILKLIFYTGEVGLATFGIGELEGREQLKQSYMNWASYKGNTWIPTTLELITGKNIVGQEKEWYETIVGAMMPILVENVISDVRNGEEAFTAVRDSMPELFGFNTSKYEDQSAIKIRY